MTLQITVLGCGASTGVPVITCDCEICRTASTANRNERTRSSILVSHNGRNILVDTSPDLRRQVLDNAVKHVDAIIYTHTHADHVYGLDDVRLFNFRQRADIPVYGSAATLAALKQFFSYIFDGESSGGGKPSLVLNAVEGPFSVFGLEVRPVDIYHGRRVIQAYRFGDFAYVTDCSAIPERSWPLLEGVEVLLLGALRHRPHPTHFSVAQALEAAARMGARRTYLTHLTHDMEYARENTELPQGVELAYDGMIIEC